MVKFSLSNALPNAKSILFIPDTDYILKFLNGDLGIANSIFKETMSGVVSSSISMLNNSKNSNQNTADVIKELSRSVPKNNRGDVEYLKSKDVQEYAKKNNININSVKATNKLSDNFTAHNVVSMVLKPFNTNIDEIDNNSFLDGSWKNLLKIDAPEYSGLKPFEKTSIQSIFETMKPYIEVIRLVLQSMVKIEDIIAIILGIGTKSLNPIYNPEALGYRGREKTAMMYAKYLEELLNFLNQSDINKKNKIKANKARTKTGKLVSETTEYSTGEYDAAYKYIYSYIDIFDETINIDFGNSSTFDYDDEFIEDRLPESIIFGYYDRYGNKIDTNNERMPDWLRFNHNNYGNFGFYENITMFRETIRDMVIDKMTAKYKLSNPNYNNNVREAINIVDTNDLYNKINDKGFLKTIFKEGVPHILPQKTFKPSKIRVLRDGITKRDLLNNSVDTANAYRDVWIDAESDYDLKLIKVRSRYNGEAAHSNSHLMQKNTPILPNSYYGFPDDENRQQMGEATWYYNDYMYDRGYYIDDIYIVQGILDNETKESIRSKKKRTYYKTKDFFKIPFRFISIITDIIAKVIPSLKQIQKIFTNPTEFIFEIIKAKLGDNQGTENIKFLAYSKPFLDEYEQFNTRYKGIINEVSNNNTITDTAKQDLIYERSIKELSRLPLIKDYFYINKYTGELKFMLDGAALIELFGFVFGANVSFPNIDFVFKKLKTNKSNEDNDYESNHKNLPASIKEIFGLKGEEINSYFPNNSKMRKIIEDTWYSTGVYKEEYSYTWIYLDETQKEIYDEANRIFDKYKDLFADIKNSGDHFDITKSSYYNIVPAEVKKDLRILHALLSLVLGFGYNDQLFEQIQNIRKLLVDSLNNPTIKVILELVATPIKLVKKIVDYLTEFFSKITNPFTLPSKMSEFVKFEWFTDIVNPLMFLKLIGINFNPLKITELSKYLISGLINNDTTAENNKYLNQNLDSLSIPDALSIKDARDKNSLLFAIALIHDTTKLDVKQLINITASNTRIDIRELISVNFFDSIGTLNLEQFKIILEQEILRLIGLLRFIKSIGKSIIQFFYSLFGLNSKKETPDFDTFKNILTDDDIIDVIEGSYNGLNVPKNGLNTANITKNSIRSVIYDIHLPDGTNINNLTPYQLVEWITLNKNNYNIKYG